MSAVLLDLRRTQMLTDTGIDNCITSTVLIPSEFTNVAKSFSHVVNQQGK